MESTTDSITDTSEAAAKPIKAQIPWSHTSHIVRPMSNGRNVDGTCIDTQVKDGYCKIAGSIWLSPAIFNLREFLSRANGNLTTGRDELLVIFAGIWIGSPCLKHRAKLSGLGSGVDSAPDLLMHIGRLPTRVAEGT
jgi:hypothetical protein